MLDFLVIDLLLKILVYWGVVTSMILFLLELKGIDPMNDVIRQSQELIHFVHLWNNEELTELAPLNYRLH